MKKLLVILLISLSFIIGCSKEEEKPIQQNQQQQVEKRYWVNSSSNVIHNRSCRWFNNTKEGFLTNDCSSYKSCGICGGCK